MQENELLILLEKEDFENIIYKLLENGTITSEQLEDAVIKSYNIESICKITYFKGVSSEKLGDFVISTKIPYFIYYYTLKANKAPISKLVDALIETKDLSLINILVGKLADKETPDENYEKYIIKLLIALRIIGHTDSYNRLLEFAFYYPKYLNFIINIISKEYESDYENKNIDRNLEQKKKADVLFELNEIASVKEKRNR